MYDNGGKKEEVEVVIFIREERRSSFSSMESFDVFEKAGRRTARTCDPHCVVLVAAGRDVEVMEGLPGSLWPTDMSEQDVCFGLSVFLVEQRRRAYKSDMNLFGFVSGDRRREPHRSLEMRLLEQQTCIRIFILSRK